jgi:hypothetical protein
MTLNFFNQGKPHHRNPVTADDRLRAVNVLREFLRNQDYIPAEVARAMQVLVPELRDRQAGGPD